MSRITLCAAVAAALAAAGEVARTPSVAITRVTVLDGCGGPPRRNSTVVVSGGVITAVHTGAVPRTVDTIDGHDGYLVPGFIDMHAHLLFPRCSPLADGSVFDRVVSERMLSTGS